MVLTIGIGGPLKTKKNKVVLTTRIGGPFIQKNKRRSLQHKYVVLTKPRWGPIKTTVLIGQPSTVLNVIVVFVYKCITKILTKKT